MKYAIRSAAILGILAVCLPLRSALGQGPQLSLRDHGFPGSEFDYWFDWCAVSVQDAVGAPITGLSLDKFQLTESLVSKTSGVVDSKPIDIASQAAKDPATGFWERSLGARKLDVVFMVDVRGTMGAYLSGITTQIDLYIDRLVQSRADFRVGALTFDPSTFLDLVPFQGVMQIAELKAGIADCLGVNGGGALPSASYDAILNGAELGFRQDAEKLGVVITDNFPQNVYGAYWYPMGCTAATLSAIELCLQKTGLKLFYSQDPATHIVTQGYIDPNSNPRAGNDQSGFEALRQEGLAVKLDWPFHQDQIPAPEASVPVVDSQYFLAWDSALVMPDDPENYEIRIALQVEAAGQALTAAYSFPLEVPTATVTVNPSDEAGNPDTSGRAEAVLEYAVGDRRVAFMTGCQGSGQSQIVVESVPVGTYHLTCETDGGTQGLHVYPSLGAFGEVFTNVPPQGLTVDLTLQTMDKVAELSKARGLLKDLDDWRISGAPFHQFVQDATAWLDTLEATGIPWDKMVALKRFYIALSGYANFTEYAQRECEGAIQDFHGIINDFREVIAKVNDLQGSTSQSWQMALADKVLDILYAILTKGEVNGLKEAVEQGLEQLLQYAAGQLLADLKQLAIEQIPAGEYNSMIKSFLLTLTLPEGDPPDWGPVIEAAEKLAIATALEEVVGTLEDHFMDDLFANLQVSGPLEPIVKDFLKDVLVGLVVNGFDNLNQSLDLFAQEVANYVKTEGRENVTNAVVNLFNQLQDQLPASDARDFLLGLTRDFVLAAIPTVNPDGSLSFHIDSDMAIGALIKHGLYYVVLKNYYVEKVNHGLTQALLHAKSYVPRGQRPSQWECSMGSDFGDYRSIVGDLQDPAWAAFDEQAVPEGWADAMEGLASILSGLGDALQVIGGLYPDLMETADKVKEFATVLDAVTIIPRAIEFGLKIDSLDQFGAEAAPLYRTVFPDPRLLSPTLTRAGFTLSLLTDLGKSYVLEYKDSLSQSAWTALPPIVGNGQTNTLADLSATAPQRFYRVRELP